jgi:hypothetical protein
VEEFHTRDAISLCIFYLWFSPSGTLKNPSEITYNFEKESERSTENFKQFIN